MSSLYSATIASPTFCPGSAKYYMSYTPACYTGYGPMSSLYSAAIAPPALNDDLSITLRDYNDCHCFILFVRNEVDSL